MWILGYWVFPVISASMWLAMLLVMLITWEAEGAPYYASFNEGQTIAYISDIGAQGLKPLFVTGCVITTIFLDLSFASDRWLRHKGILIPNSTVLEKAFSILAIFFAIVGTFGLILLSIYDTLRHPGLHDIFLLLFIGGYIISAIFLCAEYQQLQRHYRQHRILRVSFWLKLFFIVIEIALAFAFGISQFCNSANAAAILEWVIALIYTFWVLSFFIDLLPAVRTKRHLPQGARMTREMIQCSQAPTEVEEDLTRDSRGDAPNYLEEARQHGLGAERVYNF